MIYRQLLERGKGRYDDVCLSLEKNKGKLEEARDTMDEIIEAQRIIKIAADIAQSQIKVHLENLVSKALEIVFPEKPYKFDVTFKPVGDRYDTVLSFVRNGIKRKPKRSSGGGALDVASLALRLALWKLSKKDNFMMLDEPLKFLSEDKHEFGGQLIKELSKELEIQFLIATHTPVITGVADRIFHCVLEGDESKVTLRG